MFPNCKNPNPRDFEIRLHHYFISFKGTLVPPVITIVVLEMRGACESPILLELLVHSSSIFLSSIVQHVVVVACSYSMQCCRRIEEMNLAMVSAPGLSTLFHLHTQPGHVDSCGEPWNHTSVKNEECLLRNKCTIEISLKWIIDPTETQHNVVEMKEISVKAGGMPRYPIFHSWHYSIASWEWWSLSWSMCFATTNYG